MLKNKINTNQLIKYSILVYWSIFWFFNILDKLIGGSVFLWVGRDRFAQFQKFFASAGLESPIIADAALVVAAGLEVFAFVFFTGALIHFLKKRQDTSRSWFFIGICFTLITFTIFSIGDHVFGDRFELLEHTLFWFLTLFSWVIFIRLEKNTTNDGDILITKKQLLMASLVSVLLVLCTSISIFSYNENYFHRRTDALPAIPVGENIYKVSFPFLGGSTVFEKSIEKFKNENPTKKINHIYTVPNPLRLKKADGLIFYIITDNKE
ncbi:MAG: hypothetical protein CL846_01885 [Crocinitomicaceae bacterium]|nr:hypothetical protein [Crocinitomicaceae bacterium]|tara:strand:- start:2866 stop:3663 length:798 start_codon:yes stop_codon:yes gene_type:complete